MQPSNTMNATVLSHRGIGIVAFSWRENDGVVSIVFNSNNTNPNPSFPLQVMFHDEDLKIGGTTNLMNEHRYEFPRSRARGIWQDLVSHGWTRKAEEIQ